MTNRRNALRLFRLEIVEILVKRVTRMDLVLDAVESGQEHRTKREIRVRGRIRETDFDAPRFRVCDVRNTHRCRPVAGRISQHYRRFESRYQAFVAVCRRVGKCIKHFRMLDDATDIKSADTAFTSLNAWD